MITISIFGGTGLIGKYLAKLLTKNNYKVFIFTRNSKIAKKQGYAYWNPNDNKIDEEKLFASDYIINLTGENVANKRWTYNQKNKINDSRTLPLYFLFQIIANSDYVPKAFISASAVGYYGATTSQHIFSEQDDAGYDFMARTCINWENTIFSFKSLNIRTVALRIGIVLAPEAKIIKQLKSPVKMGILPILGSGKQYLPWIHINDLTRMFKFAIENRNISGIYNAVAPEHCNFEHFAKSFAKPVAKKYAQLRIPGIIIKTLFGEMSDIMLKGSRISSDKIQQTGYNFNYYTLKKSLSQISNPFQS